MKIVRKLATLTLMILAVSICGFSQDRPAAAKKPLLNLVRGVVGPVSASNSWSGFSALNLIPGAGVIPVSSPSTVFYLGFAAGSQADISNMVLYTTARQSTTITAVTPITYGGVSNPSINLTSTSVCPIQPLLATSPCIVRLDPVTLSLSALSDYYLVVYFTAGDNNDNSIAGTFPYLRVSSLSGWYIGADETGLAVGQSIPGGYSGSAPYFLMYAMTN